MSERVGYTAAYGTWQDRHKTRGDYSTTTHIQRLFDLAPEPKLELEGLGKRHGWIGKAFGGAFGVGAGNRVERAVRWYESRTLDRLVIFAHSRGCGIAGAIVREEEARRAQAWRLGWPASEWKVTLVLLDPVLSFGFAAPWKWMTRWLPASWRWHLNTDRYRTLPAFVDEQIALYSLDEDRTAFAPTHFRLTAPGGYTWRRWVRGYHADIAGYGPSDYNGVDAGSWLRLVLGQRLRSLYGAAWPWPAIKASEWREVPAKPVSRWVLPGDLAVVRS